MPNPWTQLGNFAPGIITSLTALALFWLTQRHQPRLEIAKDEIAAEARSRDSRWAFRKEVYVNLISATSAMIRASSGVAINASQYVQLKQEGVQTTDERMTAALKQLKHFGDAYQTNSDVFGTYVSLAPLAIAEDVVPLVFKAWETLNPFDIETPEFVAANVAKHVEALGDLTRKLWVAGRKDLWGTREEKAKDEAAT
jgi:hypothetical protein